MSSVLAGSVIASLSRDKSKSLAEIGPEWKSPVADTESQPWRYSGTAHLANGNVQVISYHFLPLSVYFVLKSNTWQPVWMLANSGAWSYPTHLNWHGTYVDRFPDGRHNHDCELLLQDCRCVRVFSCRKSITKRVCWNFYLWLWAMKVNDIAVRMPVSATNVQIKGAC